MWYQRVRRNFCPADVGFGGAVPTATSGLERMGMYVHYMIIHYICISLLRCLCCYFLYTEPGNTTPGGLSPGRPEKLNNRTFSRSLREKPPPWRACAIAVFVFRWAVELSSATLGHKMGYPPFSGTKVSCEITTSMIYPMAGY